MPPRPPHTPLLAQGRDALARVTRAAVQLFPDELHYSKGLHQMAAFVLVVFGLAHEEAAFWTLVALLRKRLFPEAGGDVLLGAYVEQGVLEQLLAKKHSRVTAHISSMGWTLSDLTKGWIDMLFTSHLPPETAVRVWDAVMSEGVKVVHRVALALLKRHEAVLLGCHELSVTKKVLELRMKQLSDDAQLLAAAFTGVGSMPSALLGAMRGSVRRSAACARFVELHGAQRFPPVEKNAMLALDPAVLAAAPPPPPAGAGRGRGYARTTSRLSFASTSGESRAGSAVGGGQSSAACSEDGSDAVVAAADAGIDADQPQHGQQQQQHHHHHKSRTASGRPRASTSANVPGAVRPAVSVAALG
eukprot:53602-Chlamydomonas_euryale.AAC.1